MSKKNPFHSLKFSLLSSALMLFLRFAFAFLSFTLHNLSEVKVLSILLLPRFLNYTQHKIYSSENYAKIILKTTMRNFHFVPRRKKFTFYLLSANISPQLWTSNKNSMPTTKEPTKKKNMTQRRNGREKIEANPFEMG